VSAASAVTIPQRRIDEIRRAADADGRSEPLFHAEVVDEVGDVVAEVDKVLHVRRRRPDETG
jgi:hypothetical protein